MKNEPEQLDLFNDVYEEYAIGEGRWRFLPGSERGEVATPLGWLPSTRTRSQFTEGDRA